jgi:hypothetical protein
MNCMLKALDDPVAVPPKNEKENKQLNNNKHYRYNHCYVFTCLLAWSRNLGLMVDLRDRVVRVDSAVLETCRQTWIVGLPICDHLDQRGSHPRSCVQRHVKETRSITTAHLHGISKNIPKTGRPWTFQERYSPSAHGNNALVTSWYT